MARIILAAAMFVAAMSFDLRPAPAHSVHGSGRWCVIENTGRAEWFCWPTRALCQRLGQRPGTADYCVEYPVWSGR